MIIVFIGQPAAVGEDGCREVVIFILIAGDAALDIGDGLHIAVIVIGIAAAEFLQEELNAVKEGIVAVIVIGQLQGDLGISTLCHQGCRGTLPAGLILRGDILGIEIEIARDIGIEGGDGAFTHLGILVIEGGDEGKPAVDSIELSQGDGVTLRPAPQDEAISRITADNNVLVDPGCGIAVAGELIHLAAEPRSGGGIGSSDAITAAPAVCAAEVAVFHQVIAAGGGGIFQLYAIDVNRACAFRQHLGGDIAGGRGGVMHLQAAPAILCQIKAQGLPGYGSAAVTQSQADIGAGGLDPGGEGIAFPGFHRDGRAFCTGSAIPGRHDLQGFAAQLGHAGVVAQGCPGEALPGLGILKAALGEQIHHGVLQLGGQGQLVGLSGAFGAFSSFRLGTAVDGILGILGPTLIVPDGQGVAHVVKLQDLHIAVVIRQCGLILLIGEVQLAAQGAIVELLYRGYSCGFAQDFTAIRKLQGIALTIPGRYQQIGNGMIVGCLSCPIGVGAYLSVRVGDGNQLTRGIVTELHGINGFVSQAQVIDLPELTVVVIGEDIVTLCTVGDDGNSACTVIGNQNAAGDLLIIL